MDAIKVCDKCGMEIPVDAPEGRCPRCLMAAGMETLGAETLLEAELSKNEPVELDVFDEVPGKYTMLGEHARGGMGRVLLVHDESLGRQVALKELLPGRGSSSNSPTPAEAQHAKELAARFLREARITGQLEHPSITPVHELGRREDGSLYYTMKLVKGKTLKDAIAECETLEERLKLLSHFVDLCNAIAYAHSRNVIHRDIKPANVMIGEYGETVILDWGLAKVKDDADDAGQTSDPNAETVMGVHQDTPTSGHKTSAGQLLGTPVYMSPEQAKGLPADERSDIYSLGAVLYEILTGRPVFDGKTVDEIIAKVIYEEPESLHDAQLGLSNSNSAPPELLTIVAKAIDKRPEARFSSADKFSNEIERFQSGGLVSGHRYSLIGYTRFLWNQYKPQIMTATVAIIILITVSSMFTVGLIHSNTLLTQSRDQETRQRELAEAARDAEATERARADKNSQRFENSAYISSIRLVQAYLDQSQTELAHDILIKTPSHLRNWEWGHLYKAIDTSLATFSGHRDTVYDAAYSPDGARIVTASSDRTAKVWDADTQDELFTLTGHKGAVNVAKYSPDGKRILTASSDGTAKLWDAITGVLLSTLAGHEGGIWNANFGPDGLRILTASVDGTAKAWDVATGEELLSLPGGDESIVVSAVYHPDYEHILTANMSGISKVWNASTGEELLSIASEDEGSLVSSAYSPDGASILTVSNLGEASVWDSTSGNKLQTYKFDRDFLNDATYSPNGAHIITCGQSGTVKVWRSESGELMGSLQGHNSDVQNVVVSPDGSNILTASEDRTAKVWNIESRPELMTLVGHKGAVFHLATSPDGMHILTASDDQTAKAWDASTGELLTTLSGHEDEIWSAVYSPDGSRILTASKDGSAKIWDANSGTLMITLDGHESTVGGAVYSSDGASILTTSFDRTVKMWNADTGNLLVTLTGHQGEVRRAVYSPDGTRILTSSEDKTARVWDVNTGKELFVLSGHTGYVWDAEYSLDGLYILTASWDKTAKLWDANTGKQILTLTGHDDGINEAKYSPDGTQILTNSHDKTAKIWDAGTGVVLNTLAGHKGEIWSAEYSMDGSRILTASSDGTAKVWDANTGDLLATLVGHNGDITKAIFSTDGERVLTASFDKTVKIWDSAIWRINGWADTSSRAQLLPLALRKAPDILTMEYGSVDESIANSISELDEWRGAWLEKGTNPPVQYIDGQGILILDPNRLPVFSGSEFSLYDLIIRINGITLKSLDHAIALLSEYVSLYSVDPSRQRSVCLETVNLDTHRLIVLDIPGEFENVVTFPRARWQSLVSLAITITKANKKTAETEGRDIDDTDMFVTAPLAATLNLEANDRIISIAGEPIRGHNDMVHVLEKTGTMLNDVGMKNIPMLVHRAWTNQYIHVTLQVED